METILLYVKSECIRPTSISGGVHALLFEQMPTTFANILYDYIQTFRQPCVVIVQIMDPSFDSTNRLYYGSTGCIRKICSMYDHYMTPRSQTAIPMIPIIH